MFSIFKRTAPPPENDFSLLPSLDDDDDPALSTNQQALDEKQWAEMEAAQAAEARHQQAEADIRYDEVVFGCVWSAEARQLLLARRVGELEDLDRLTEGLIELDRLRLEVAESDRRLLTSRHRELVDTIERGNIAAKALDFAMAHPFLTGFIGTGVAEKLRRR